MHMRPEIMFPIIISMLFPSLPVYFYLINKIMGLKNWHNRNAA